MITAIVIIVLAIAGYIYIRSHKAQVATAITTVKADVRTDITAANQRIASLEASVKALAAKVR